MPGTGRSRRGLWRLYLPAVLSPPHSPTHYGRGALPAGRPPSRPSRLSDGESASRATPWGSVFRRSHRPVRLEHPAEWLRHAPGWRGVPVTPSVFTDTCACKRGGRAWHSGTVRVACRGQREFTHILEHRVLGGRPGGYQALEQRIPPRTRMLDKTRSPAKAGRPSGAARHADG